MRKILIIAILLTLAINDVAAQENRYYSANGKQINYLGLRLNYDYLANIYADFCGHSFQPFRGRSGASFGAIYHVGFHNRFYLEPGAEIYYNAHGITPDFYNRELKHNGNLSTVGVRVPLKAGMAFPFNKICMLAYIGVAESYAFYGRETAEFKNPEINKISRSAFHTLKRFETLLCFGYSLAYNNFCYTLNFNYGLTNCMSMPDYSSNSLLLQLGIGYNF